MKVFISADIEGVTGVTHWDETELSHAENSIARQQMTAEVAAACEGAMQAGASEVWVKDSHDTARNIIAAQLPQATRLVRGWSGHPFMMLQELDNTFQAAMLVGYHSGAGAGKSPLEHTYSGNVWKMHLNGVDVSEFLMAAYTAAYVHVPLVFISGDQGLCDEAARLIPSIKSVAVKQGVGNSTISIHPNLAIARIRETVVQALEGDLSACLPPLPNHFLLEIHYRPQTKAYEISFYPGARQTGPRSVQLETEDFFDLLRFLLFAL